jgi:hypothetical protein
MKKNKQNSKKQNNIKHGGIKIALFILGLIFIIPVIMIFFGSSIIFLIGAEGRIINKYRDLSYEDQLIYGKAIKEGNVNLCNELTSKRILGSIVTNLPLKYPRSQCIQDVAVHENDPNTCDLIDKEGIRNGCFSILAVVQNNITLCDNVSDSSKCKYDVFDSMAAKNKDISICDKHEEKWRKDACKVDIVIRKNPDMFNKSVCAELDLSRDFYKSRCESAISNWENYSGPCKKDEDPIRCYLSENRYKGLNHLDPSLCANNFKNTEDMMDCIVNNLSLERRISGYEIMIKNKYCDIFEDDSEIYKCYYKLFN